MPFSFAGIRISSKSFVGIILHFNTHKGFCGSQNTHKLFCGYYFPFQYPQTALLWPPWVEVEGCANG